MPEAPKPQDVNQLLRYSHLGVQFCMVFGLIVALGFFADRKLGTVPLFTIVGVLGGFAAAFYQLYVAVFGATGPGDGERPPGGGG